MKLFQMSLTATNCCVSIKIKFSIDGLDHTLICKLDCVTSYSLKFDGGHRVYSSLNLGKSDERNWSLQHIIFNRYITTREASRSEFIIDNQYYF